MDNLHDLGIRASAQAQSAADANAQLTIVKFWHVVCGLYIWEFITTADYEWRVFRGELPYRWTIWVYSWARVSCLVGVALLLSTMSITTEINCQLWILFASIFFCSSATAATLLIVLRTMAIWDGNKPVIALTLIVWGVSISFHLHDIVLVDYIWDTTEQVCKPLKTIPSTLSFVPTMIADMALCLIISAGLIVLRRRGNGTVGLTHLLWKQGLIWLALGTIADVPQLVFTMTNLNNQWSSMFETPSVIIMTIAVTRMHRSLVNFATGGRSQASGSTPQSSSLLFSKNKRTAPIALDRIEVVVDTTFEQHSKSTRSVDGSSMIISTKSTCPLSPSPLSRAQLEDA